MTIKVAVELIGGPGDGRLFEVPWNLLAGTGVLRLPIAPSLGEMLTGIGRLDAPLEPELRTIEYQWDGTVREDGTRRMRYLGDR